jgi:hypothetical protein
MVLDDTAMGNIYEIETSPCLCGEGMIEVTQTSPDRSSKSTANPQYRGRLICAVCETRYRVIDRGTRYPYLARIDDIQQAMADIEAKIGIRSEGDAILFQMDQMREPPAGYRFEPVVTKAVWMAV